MEQILELDKIHDYKLKKGILYCVRDFGLEIIDSTNQNKERIEIKDFETEKIDFTSKYLVLRDSRNFFKIYDLENYKEVENQYAYLRCSEIKEELALVYDKTKENRPYGIIDLNQLKLLFLNSDFKINHFYPKESFLLDNKTLRIYDTQTGELKNELTLEINDLYKAKLFLINSSNLIIYFLDSIYLLDRKSGIIKKWDSYDREYIKAKTNGKISHKTNKFGQVQLTIRENRIILFDYNIFSVIDLESFEMKSVSLFDYFQKIDISGNWTNFEVVEDSLFCISDQSGDWIKNENHKLFEFSMKNKLVIDSWQLPKVGKSRRGFNIGGVHLNNDLISIKEQDDTLHILKIKADNKRS